MLVGIDLGTTNSLISVFKEGEAQVIPNRLGKLLTPSVVSVTEDGTVLVGEVAKEYGLLHPLSTAATFKRSMGTEREYVLEGRKFTPEELSGLVLRSLKEDAEQYTGEEVTEAIISVPAYFNDYQRRSTKHAGELAGMKVSRIINEPTAAAMAYGVGSGDKDERCLVFDLGGGTFDVSILEFFGSIMEVHAVAGDNFLGGEDFTAVLSELFLNKVGVSRESLGRQTLYYVRAAAEKAKLRFSDSKEVEVACVIDGEEKKCTVSLSEYEKACDPLVERLRTPIERSLRDAKISVSSIDRVILVGGATRLPIVRSFVAKMFRIIPSLTVDPDTAVAIGAAVQCALKERNKAIEEIVLTDVCPFTLGTEVIQYNGAFDEGGHYLPIIERNTVIPVSRTDTLYTACDDQEKVKIKILQGESRMARNNLLLGEVVVAVPPAPKGQEAVTVTYTYDINSILEVEVAVLSTGLKKRVIIQGGSRRMSDEEVEERMKKLSYLKQNPRDDEANRLILLRAERMYEELFSDDRNRINMLIMEFERALDKQDRQVIEQARKELEAELDRIGEDRR